MKDTVYIKYDVFGFILTYVNIFAQGLRINQSPMGKKKKKIEDQGQTPWSGDIIS